MRRHVRTNHAGLPCNRAAESFVSFIPLFDGLVAPVRVRCAVLPRHGLGAYVVLESTLLDEPSHHPHGNRDCEGHCRQEDGPPLRDWIHCTLQARDAQHDEERRHG